VICPDSSGEAMAGRISPQKTAAYQEGKTNPATGDAEPSLGG
jgi:hypothetical protein